MHDACSNYSVRAHKALFHISQFWYFESYYFSCHSLTWACGSIFGIWLCRRHWVWQRLVRSERGLLSLGYPRTRRKGKFYFQRSSLSYLKILGVRIITARCCECWMFSEPKLSHTSFAALRLDCLVSNNRLVRQVIYSESAKRSLLLLDLSSCCLQAMIMFFSVSKLEMSATLM